MPYTVRTSSLLRTRRLRRIVAGLALVWAIGLTTLATAQAPVAPERSTSDAVALDKKLIDLGKKDSEIMANLTHLCDVIGPRLTGSAALKNANDWTAEKMKSYGLSNVHLEGYTIPVGWERGTATAKIVDPPNGRQILLASAGWSPGTNGKVVGDVVIFNARKQSDLAQYKGKLKNAIIIMSPPSTVRPVADGRYLEGLQRPAPGATAAATPEKTPVAAPAAQKAATEAPVGGPVQREKTADQPERKVVSDTPPAAQPQKAASKDGSQPEKTANKEGGQPPAAQGKQGDQPRGGWRGGFGGDPGFAREVGEFLRTEGAAAILRDSAKPHGLLVTTGGWAGQDRASGRQPIPTLYVAHEHYALLHRLASRPEPNKVRMELEVTNKMVPGPVAVYNTVGEITGSEKPDEIVVVGAHLDSWDLAQGTTDNGTGSAIVLEVARILSQSGVKPKRTIRFVLFSGEEQGLHGSRDYVQKHKDEMAKHSMAIVHDTGTGKVIGIGLQRRDAVKKIFEQEMGSLKDLGVTTIDTGSMSGTDHQSFESAGVPGFAMRQDMAEYRFTHHTQSDTLDKAQEANLVQGAQVMAVVAMRVANLPALLPRERAGR